jgi:NAD+ kinase
MTEDGGSVADASGLDPAAIARPARSGPIRTADVWTHRRPEETEEALTLLVAEARRRGITLRFGPEETLKHPTQAADPVVDANAGPRDPGGREVDLVLALGGDGTILNALRGYAGSGIPVFAFNFGEMGFLATVDREDAISGVAQALDGNFEVMSLPGIEVTGSRGRWLAINDVSMHRQPGKRVADLEYRVDEDDVGRVRCDGLVVATPAGSTGYNLANGGPVMAWGVHGYVVSFIAPHSFTARTLVVAPDDRVSVHNRSQEEPVDVSVDGRPICTLEPGEWLQTRFVNGRGALAQIPGTNFYQRLRQKFGRLATPM